VHEVAHARKQNPLTDLNKILHGGRYPRRNHLCQFWWGSVKGLRGGGGQSLPFSIDFDSCPYNTLALPCECVMQDIYGSGQLGISSWFTLGDIKAWLSMLMCTYNKSNVKDAIFGHYILDIRTWCITHFSSAPLNTSSFHLYNSFGFKMPDY